LRFDRGISLFFHRVRALVGEIEGSSLGGMDMLRERCFRKKRGRMSRLFS
jgi:hypothetical protein